MFNRHIQLSIFPILFLPIWGCAASSRSFTFEYEIEIHDLPATARSVDIWLPVPEESPCQHVHAFKTTSPVEGHILRENAYGDRIWHARIPVGDASSLRIIQQVEIVRRECSAQQTTAADHELDGPQPNRFLEPNHLVPAAPRFARMARELTEGRTQATDRARALYDHVLRSMRYDKTGTGWGRGDADFACDVGRGNCTDFHSLFIALCRAAGIPARFRIGFPLPSDRGSGSVGGYHCWAEFWTDKAGWTPVDISEAWKHPDLRDYFFGNIDENRIAYSMGRDLRLSPPQQGPPINFFIYPHVEVDGQPWDRVNRQFRYKNL